jgi:hypothetical protein
MLAVCAAALLMCAVSARAQRDDAYLAGYATAVIERDLALRVVSLEVHDGVARVVVESLGDQPAERIEAALTEIEGIERVEVSESGSATQPAAPRTRAPPTREPDERRRSRSDSSCCRASSSSIR